MASYINMSLEDIIQKKKIESKRNKNTIKTRKFKNQLSNQKIAVTDARNKIISKKRTQIFDAREKLAELAKQKDARLKLDQLRKKRLQEMTHIQERYMYQNRGKFVRTIPNKDRVFIDPSRQVMSQPLTSARISTKRNINTKKFMENRSIGNRVLDKMSKIKPIVRTIENDIEVIDDPMGEEFIPHKKNPFNRKASLQLKIITHNSDIRENRSSVVHRTAVTEKEKSPPRPPSILKKRPMAALRTEKNVEKPEITPNLEFRILVSNLRNTVTGGDIEELFGDVGGMLESRLVRPGTAEVIYKSIEDAQRAVDLYHNRQLDGQPMNCLLVTPRSTATPLRSSSKPALYSTNSNVEPDISTFHKVLFSNF